MKRFDKVKGILDAAVNNAQIGAHKAFWRGLDLASFKLKRVYGKELVVVGDGPNSNLVLALRGLAPFGSDIGTAGATTRRMPAGLPPVSDAEIAFIETWITDGCPDDDVPAGG
ncbi:MAG: hypothetical protein JNK21_13430 [Rhodospirillaceae bacterium]|nr:hypothetical protein [Rhodospirillaceae bacterium]